MNKHEIPRDHPRYESLKTREDIIEGMHQKVVAEAGLIAHGRGEAFDYILGEESPEFAFQQEKFAIITLLLAKRPVISVNGNVAVLCPKEIVQLGEILEDWSGDMAELTGMEDIIKDFLEGKFE